MLICFTRKESKLMVKRALENLKLIYEIRNHEGCTVIHWKIKFCSEVPVGFILLSLWEQVWHSSKLSYLGRVKQVSPETRPASAGNAQQSCPVPCMCRAGTPTTCKRRKLEVSISGKDFKHEPNAESGRAMSAKLVGFGWKWLSLYDYRLSKKSFVRFNIVAPLRSLKSSLRSHKLVRSTCGSRVLSSPQKYCYYYSV